jgi:hypothetical protein
MASRKSKEVEWTCRSSSRLVSITSTSLKTVTVIPSVSPILSVDEVQLEHTSGLVRLAEIAAVMHLLIELVGTMKQEQKLRLVTELIHDQTQRLFLLKGKWMTALSSEISTSWQSFTLKSFGMISGAKAMNFVTSF